MGNRVRLISGGVALAVFVAWWAAWQPGFIGAEAIERLARIRSFELTTDDPALYTTVLWAISAGGRSAALATFIQGGAWALLAGAWAQRLVTLGARPPIATTAVAVVALLPAVAVGMLGLWPETLLTLAAGWLLLELEGGSAVRLGAALGTLAALGVVGLIASLSAAVVLFFGDHAVSGDAARRLGAMAAAIAVVGWLGLPWLMGMERGRAETPSVAPIIAAAVTHHPEDVGAVERRDLELVADFDLWQQLYDCADPSALVDDREFDEDAISAGRMGELAWRSFARHPFTAVGQRICAGTGLITPALPEGSRFYLPDYAVFPNGIGVTRTTLWTGARDATKAVLIRTQQTDRLIWWWRPALPVIAAGGAYLALALKKRRMAMGAAIVVGLLCGVFVAGPSPRFEVALPLYLVGWMSATLLVTLLPQPSPRRGPPGS